MKYSSKNIRELSIENMLRKSLKLKKNKGRIPKGNIKKYKNINNRISNLFILKNEVKSYAKTIEQEEQIKNLKEAKLYKSINEKKEKGKERKPKKFHDKYIKYYVSFNKLNISSQNESISLNKKVNNKYNNIKTKFFNYKTYKSKRHKTQKCLKNNSQKPKDKIVINSINSNSYKNNNAKTKKNRKKINIKMYSKSEISNYSSYDKKMIDDNIKIENIHSDGDLDKVGEIIEDDCKSKKWIEMTDINENNIINNPRSLEAYSSIVFSIKKDNDIKLQSLSVSKENKNSYIKKNIFKSNNPEELKKEKNKFNNIPEIKNLNQKIEEKNKNIEKIKKLIEYYKKQMVKYDNEIIKIDNWILREEKEREEFQVMVNFLNVQ